VDKPSEPTHGPAKPIHGLPLCSQDLHHRRVRLLEEATRSPDPTAARQSARRRGRWPDPLHHAGSAAPESDPRRQNLHRHCLENLVQDRSVARRCAAVIDSVGDVTPSVLPRKQLIKAYQEHHTYVI
jgi:hypothetical protein